LKHDPIPIGEASAAEIVACRRPQQKQGARRLGWIRRELLPASVDDDEHGGSKPGIDQCLIASPDVEIVDRDMRLSQNAAEKRLCCSRQLAGRLEIVRVSRHGNGHEVTSCQDVAIVHTDSVRTRATRKSCEKSMT
jgi:hypothetical protein